ncbi:amino acid transporter AVT1A-like [Homalodisca vitripennis]|uniref:amino acid transporter AVT1A-like n=1 Tax=Homalodisca vitripennis TaxID=197043 RepID=UPI001EEC78FE|nr:amino acid transporter AVT1A-like [Homalodisca vitripennis]
MSISREGSVGYQSTSSSRDPIWTRVSSDPEGDRFSYGGSIETLPRGEKKSQQSGPDGGLNVISAAIFVAGEMAGSGVLAIPKAVVDCGWIGLVLVVVFCLNAGYGGTRLGHCWAIIEERYPEFRGQTRNPYPTIANKAVGRWGSLLVSGCMQFTLFGASIVYLLLSAQIVQELLKDLLPQVGYCLWFFLFAIVITPPMWLGSPKDFWIVGVGALLTTALACVLIFTQIVMDGLRLTEPVPHNPHTFQDFFFSFGTILFAYGGASTFPTIQNDMVRRDKFSVSATIGFMVVLGLYLPVVVGGYFVYGDNIDANVVISLSRGMIVSFANILMAVHLIFAFFIIVNPVCQQVEEIFQIPHEFCTKRCVARSLMVLLMVVVGETIPKFGKILALVGGSTITLTTFVLPNYFYMKLCDQKSLDWPERTIPLHMRVYMWELIVVGVVGGTFSTYSAINSIFSADSITRPCYWS